MNRLEAKSISVDTKESQKKRTNFALEWVIIHKEIKSGVFRTQGSCGISVGYVEAFEKEHRYDQQRCRLS